MSKESSNSVCLIPFLKSPSIRYWYSPASRNPYLGTKWSPEPQFQVCSLAHLFPPPEINMCIGNLDRLICPSSSSRRTSKYLEQNSLLYKETPSTFSTTTINVRRFLRILEIYFMNTMSRFGANAARMGWRWSNGILAWLYELGECSFIYDENP